MPELFTIGFTKSTAQCFFERLRAHRVGIVLDVRLNRASQLAGFAKYPDIEYFLREVCAAQYAHDLLLAPDEALLSQYRKQEIDWAEYETRFEALMQARDASAHIEATYRARLDERICLLCSEDTPTCCHRRLVAERFARIFPVKVEHL